MLAPGVFVVRGGEPVRACKIGQQSAKTVCKGNAACQTAMRPKEIKVSRDGNIASAARHVVIVSASVE